MRIPQKWQYALRAIFDLARRGRREPVKVADIAEAQAIPPRFLEVILNQLKRAGIVDSRRGNEGGYFLLRSPSRLTVSDVLRCLEGHMDILRCKTTKGRETCPLKTDCVFMPVWERALNAMWQVYDETTFEQLVNEATRRNEKYVPSYSI